jgi:hypothetical protein
MWLVEQRGILTKDNLKKEIGKEIQIVIFVAKLRILATCYLHAL